MHLCIYPSKMHKYIHIYIHAYTLTHTHAGTGGSPVTLTFRRYVGELGVSKFHQSVIKVFRVSADQSSGQVAANTTDAEKGGGGGERGGGGGRDATQPGCITCEGCMMLIVHEPKVDTSKGSDSNGKSNRIFPASVMESKAIDDQNPSLIVHSTSTNLSATPHACVLGNFVEKEILSHDTGEKFVVNFYICCNCRDGRKERTRKLAGIHTVLPLAEQEKSCEGCIMRAKIKAERERKEADWCIFLNRLSLPQV